MKCVYTYGQKDSLTLDKLVEIYYKSGALLTNKKIFSTEEIVNSTYSKIIEQVKLKDEILKSSETTLDENGNVVSSNKIALTAFISQENEALNSALRRSSIRFSPEYREPERILKFVKDKLIDAGEDVSKIKNLSELQDKPGYEGYLNEITTTIEAEKKSNILMSGLKSAIFRVLKDIDFITNVERELRKYLEPAVDRAITDNLLSEVDKNSMINKLIIGAQDIVSQVSRYGKPIVDVILNTEEDNPQQIIGHIDIITIDNDGNAHIFSIRSSKRTYNDWDSAKKLNSDYQLAFQRALLGQYININKTSLSLIPIELGDLSDGKLKSSGFNVGAIEPRDADPRAGLGYGTGDLWRIANSIIPARIILDYNPARREQIFLDLQKILPDYKVKTSSRIFNEEIAIRNIINKRSFTADMAKEFIDAATSDIIAKYGLRQFENKLIVNPLSKEDAAEVVNLYLDFVAKQSNQSIVRLKNAIVASINNPISRNLQLYNREQSDYVNNVLEPFLNSSYRVLDSIQELDELGIILLQNVNSGGIVAISVSANNFNAKDKDGNTYAQLEFFKIFTLLNNLYAELNLNVNPIQQVVILDLDNKTSKQGNINVEFDNYINLAISKSHDVKIKASSLPTFEETAQQNLHGYLKAYNQNDKAEISAIFNGITGNAWETDTDTLLKIHKELRSKIPNIDKKTINPDLNFSDPREYLYTLVSVLLLAKKGLLPKGDVSGLRDFAISYEDWFGVIKAFYAKDIWTTTKQGDKVVGILGGLKMITPDKVDSEDLRNVGAIISGSIDMLAHEILKRSQETQEKTVTYYKEINYGSFADNAIGNHRKVFVDLWAHDKTTREISNKWSTKNPYVISEENTLTDPQRKYLKGILFDIQRQLMEIPTEIANKIDISSLESIKRTAPSEWSEKILTGIETGEYFIMPLIRSQYLSRNKKIFSSDWESVRNALKNMFNEFRDFLDPGDLKPDELQKIKEVTDGYYEMYDIYGKHSPQWISDAVDRDTVSNWEIDLDSIAHRVIQAKTRKKYINQVLPTINAYMWWVKLSGGVQNKDVSKALAFIRERIDISFYDKSAVDREFESFVTGASVAKTITTAGMLAFRPVFLFKEGIIGLFKGVSIAMSQYFGKDQFTLKDYASAMGKLTMVDKKFSLEFNILQQINQFYRFANLDLGSYSKKIQTNRTGLLMGLSKYMYSMNTIPDYYNRLSLFLAKMIHDGSYDAHSLVNGKLEYDPRKDKRFSYYFEHRHKYLNPVKGADEKYISAKSDKEFNHQRNLYLLLMSEVNDSRRLSGLLKEFTEDDLVDQAYSEKERQSYKSFTDTVYGYYDKESAPTWHYAWYGIIFLQFMQFWPGKMSVWFSNPVEDVGGKHIQLTRKNKDGKKELLWRDVKIDSDGNIQSVDLTTKDTGDPALAWEGNIHEGVIFSFAKTIKDTFQGMGVEKKSWHDVKEEMLDKDPNRLARVKYGLADGILMMFVFSLLKMLFDEMFGDQKEGIGNEARKFSNSLSTKLLSEANMPQNTIFALKGDFLPWTYATKIMRDTQSLMDGNKTVNQVLSNVRAWEFLDDPSQR